MWGYEINSSPRARNKKGGGVTFLCKNDYKYKEIKSSKFIFFEILEVVFFCKNKVVRFSTIYRTGNLSKLDRSTFLIELNTYLESFIPKMD